MGIRSWSEVGVDEKRAWKQAAMFPDFKTIIHDGISKTFMLAKFAITNLSNNINNQNYVKRDLVSIFKLWRSCFVKVEFLFWDVDENSYIEVDIVSFQGGNYCSTGNLSKKNLYNLTVSISQTKFISMRNIFECLNNTNLPVQKYLSNSQISENVIGN